MRTITLTLTEDEAMTLRMLLIGAVIDSNEHAKRVKSPEDRAFFQDEAHMAGRLRTMVMDAMRADSPVTV